MNPLFVLLGLTSARFVTGLGKLKNAKKLEQDRGEDDPLISGGEGLEETGGISGIDIGSQVGDEEPTPEPVVQEPVVEDDPTPEPVAEDDSTPEPVVGVPIGGSGTVELQAFSSTGVFGDDLGAPIVLEFNDDISLGEGLVELRTFDGQKYVTVETLEASDLSVSGNQLIISPAFELEPLREYSLKIEPGAIEGVNGGSFEGVVDDGLAAFTSGIGVDLPSVDPADYDNIVYGQTFNSTVFVEVEDSNTLFINCTFENIDGSGMMVRGAENVTIYNCTFSNIDDFGILLRSSGSTDGVSIMSNTFEDIGGDGIHAAKRFDSDVDHTDLLVYDNDLHDIGMKGGSLYHGIYVQSSEAVVWGNDVTGFVDSNGISIRGDGIIYDNYVDITSGREYGAGIKYYSDHMTGDSKTLVIADNTVEANNLYSGIQLDMTTSKKPSEMADEDWVVNDFIIMRNDADAQNDYVIDSALEDASWASIEFVDEAPSGTTSFSFLALPEIPLDETALFTDPTVDAEQDMEFFAF